MTTSTTQSFDEIGKTLGIGSGTGRRHQLGRFLLWALLLSGVCAGAYAWLARADVSAISYQTLPVERGNLVVNVSATGTLEPIKQVEVGIEVSGTINTVEVDYNDVVKVGQVLARLDTSKLQAQRLQSDAALAVARARQQQAKATVHEAEAQMNRLKEARELSGGKLPAKHEMEAQEATLARARADEASAKASVAQAQATLEANLSDLDKAVITSPINGVVLTREVEPGQTVAAQFQSPVLFTLAEDLTQMELQVDVDEADVGMVVAGQEASFTVDAYPDTVFPAETTQVRFGSQTVEGVVTYTTVLRVDNAALKLRPGMTATALIVVDRRDDILLAPNAALRFAPPVPETEEKNDEFGLLGKIMPGPPRSQREQRPTTDTKAKEQQVWTLRNGQLEAIDVVKGLSDGVKTEIVEGLLEPGTQLVTELSAVAS